MLCGDLLTGQALVFLLGEQLLFQEEKRHFGLQTLSGLLIKPWSPNTELGPKSGVRRKERAGKSPMVISERGGDGVENSTVDQDLRSILGGRKN